jgi:hypothetical protein
MFLSHSFEEKKNPRCTTYLFLRRVGGGGLQPILFVVTNYMYIIAHILYFFILRIPMHITISISVDVRVV